jgi:hypothetical protein
MAGRIHNVDCDFGFLDPFFTTCYKSGLATQKRPVPCLARRGVTPVC